jgi:surfeit locus 1 family protein
MHETRSPRSTATFVVAIALAAFACAGFVALGAWQVHRLAWKEALIARVDARLFAAPVEAPGASLWPLLQRDADEYLRVRVRGRFDYARETLVRASTELGAGYWVLTPLRTEGGAWLLVNRGFVLPTQRGHVPHADDVQTVAGLLRFTEPHGSLLQRNDPIEARWYSRDVEAIAAAQRLEGPVAPYFIDQQVTPETAAAWPRPGLTVVHFSNDHAVYALTWFGLAAIMGGAIGYLLVDNRRLRRLAGAIAFAH